ncbi:MAG: EF-P lysine aminoacylase EpmA [Desulfobacterales bacterium]|jgi:lysyl-tRNA synthetase class 2
MDKYRQSTLRPNLQLRARIIQAIRNFFIDRQYLEIETPIRIPAPAPEAQIDAVNTEGWFLQTSPELCMKRLLAAGFSRIFQICKCFRNHERGAKHLPELTMLEWYQVGRNYKNLMDECEDLICFIAHRLDSNNSICYRGREISLATPWIRMSVTAAFQQYASLSMEASLEKNCFDEVMALEIEPNLGAPKPLFLYDYPASRGALARLKSGNDLLAERFELYIAGIELCNGFSELSDPAEQKSRFEEERHLRKSLGHQIYPMPLKFLNALEDMPVAAGNALGIDRLTMLFSDAPAIDDVVAFTPEEL